MAQEGWSLEQEEAPCTPGTPAPSLCPNNCGFFGSPATMNLCSSCYKTLVLLNSPAPAQTPTPLEPAEPKIDFSLRDLATFPASLEPASALTSSTCSTAPAEAAAATASAVEVSVCCVKVQPLRCFACQKKVGSRGFKCRCGVIFCALHRYPDTHSCSFDYRAAGRASIEKANPVVRAEKLHRI